MVVSMDDKKIELSSRFPRFWISAYSDTKVNADPSTFSLSEHTASVNNGGTNVEIQ